MLSIATLTAGVAGAETNTKPSVAVADRTLSPGQRVVVTGKAQQSFGQSLTLEYRAAGATDWAALGTAKVGQGDRFRVTGRPSGSGRLRVTVTPNAQSEPVSSREVGVRVVKGSVLKVGGRRLHVRAGRAAIVKGKGAPGDTVRLQVRRSGRWATLDRTEVRGGGAFRASARPRTPMSAPTRVVAGGAKRAVGRLNVYRTSYASWYGPGLYGNRLGCGGTLNYGTVGVAHKSLPCGTKLTLKHGSRELRVRVIDRGPYVGGREYDLTEATARKLRFNGHGPILSTK